MLKWFSRPRPIAIFARYCHYSDVSAHKRRPVGFDRKKCFANLLETIAGEKDVSLTLLLDTAAPSKERHFVHDQDRYPVLESSQGAEGASFLWMMDEALSRVKDPNTIIYFLEDDYWHLPGWVDVLREGFELGKADYVTLYDHADKYHLPQYENLSTQLFHTSSCHWRTTPSTTNTYAMLRSTLQRDAALQRQFSEGHRISKDHEKFCALKEQGALLISSVPGFSTHLEPGYLSPCTNWDKLLKYTFSKKGGSYDQ